MGFYFVAVGSAFGLGNLWRFPFIVSVNGGGAFLFVYIFAALLVGMPLLVGEFMLGKVMGKSSTAALNIRSWRLVSRFAGALCLIVLAYYAVISSWVLHFVMQLSVRSLEFGQIDPKVILEALRQNGLLQVALVSVHLLITTLVVLKGIELGLEKWVSYIMLIFVVLLIFLLVHTLSLPSAGAALRYLFYPDFTKLGWPSLMHALGHVFFTLSLGFGTMVTFGSYLRQEELLPMAAFRVTLLDLLVSIAAGLLVFPVLLGDPNVQAGPEILFQSMPVLFQQTRHGSLFGIAFFLCAYLGALAASIGLFETIVSNQMDQLGISRTRACWRGFLVGLGLAIVPSIVSLEFRWQQWRGQDVLRTIDDILVNWLLPLSVLAFCLHIAYCLPKSSQQKEFSYEPSALTLFGHWRFALRLLVPALILIALGLQIWGCL